MHVNNYTGQSKWDSGNFKPKIIAMGFLKLYMKSTKREKRGQTQERHKGKRHVQREREREKRFILIGLHILGKVRDTWKIN